MQTYPPIQPATTGSLAPSDRLRAAFAALALGGVLLFLVGFAPVTNLHNAAHDTRHGLAFPCH